MKFCQNCGNELNEEAIFCPKCGANTNQPTPVSNQQAAAENAPVNNPYSMNSTVGVDVMRQEAYAGKVKKPMNKKKVIRIVIIAVAALIVAAIVAGIVSHTVSMNAYKNNLESVYNSMTYAASEAEQYCSLQSKVWRNCIHKNESSETDKYTQDSYGYFYSDFNDALKSFYDGESETLQLINSAVQMINNNMAALKDCPSKYKDEYKAVKEMYVAFSNLADLAIGDSSYSLNTFTEALENAKSEFKTAKSAAQVLVE